MMDTKPTMQWRCPMCLEGELRIEGDSPNSQFVICSICDVATPENSELGQWMKKARIDTEERMLSDEESSGDEVDARVLDEVEPILNVASDVASNVASTDAPVSENLLRWWTQPNPERKIHFTISFGWSKPIEIPRTPKMLAVIEQDAPSEFQEIIWAYRRSQK